MFRKIQHGTEDKYSDLFSPRSTIQCDERSAQFTVHKAFKQHMKEQCQLCKMVPPEQEHCEGLVLSKVHAVQPHRFRVHLVLHIMQKSTSLVIEGSLCRGIGPEIDRVLDCALSVQLFLRFLGVTLYQKVCIHCRCMESKHTSMLFLFLFLLIFPRFPAF